jgi:hypothetical protein
MWILKSCGFGSHVDSQCHSDSDLDLNNRSDTDTDTRENHARVMYQPRTGGLRPLPDPFGPGAGPFWSGVSTQHGRHALACDFLKCVLNYLIGQLMRYI